MQLLDLRHYLVLPLIPWEQVFGSSRRFSCSLRMSLLRVDVRLIVLSHEFHMFYEIATIYFKMVAHRNRCRIIVIFPVIN